MTLRAAAVLGLSLAAATLLTGCYYPQPPAYAYYPPGCVPDAPPPPASDAEPPPEAPSDAVPPAAATPCRLVPVYASPYYPYYPYYSYYPGYYAYPGYYPYGYPSVSVGIGGRFRL